MWWLAIDSILSEVWVFLPSWSRSVWIPTDELFAVKHLSFEGIFQFNLAVFSVASLALTRPRPRFYEGNSGIQP